MASVSAKDDNWRKQQIKAQGAKLQGKKAGGGGAKKKAPAAAPARYEHSDVYASSRWVAVSGGAHIAPNRVLSVSTRAASAVRR